MATLVKIRALGRDKTSLASGGVFTGANSGSVGPARGIRFKSQFQQAESAQGGSGLVKASKVIASQITVTALYYGQYGNSITFATAVGGSSPSVAVTYAAGTGLPTVTVTAPATATLAANQAIATAINNDPVAGQLLSATATGATVNGATSGALTGGSDGSGNVLNPIWFSATSESPIVIDIDDYQNVRVLRRNFNRVISLGQP